MKNAARAFRWIVGKLETRAVPFQVVGGLAARAYGATRELHDIDIYVPAAGLGRILSDIRPHLTYGPAHHVDDCWDLTFARLEYAGQQIELGCVDGAKYVDHATGNWIPVTVDFAASESRKLFGIVVPVMPRAALIDYKTRLGREVDVRDVRDLTAR